MFGSLDRRQTCFVEFSRNVIIYRTFFRTKEFVTWSPAREFYHLPICTLYPGAWHFNVMILKLPLPNPIAVPIIAPFGASATFFPRPQVCSFVGNPWLLRMFFFGGAT